MAVSMNAGFMRSDYMISDAALPIRMEELEQTERFSKILGELGGLPENEQPCNMPEIKQKAQPDFSQTERQIMQKSDKTDVKALAGAVVRGEIKLDEIPEELVSDVLLQTIAAMMAEAPQAEPTAPEDCFAEVVPISGTEVLQPQAAVTDDAAEHEKASIPVQAQQEATPENEAEVVAAVELGDEAESGFGAEAKHDAANEVKAEAEQTSKPIESNTESRSESAAYTVNEAAQANTAEHIQRSADKPKPQKTETVHAAASTEASASQQTASRTDFSSQQDDGSQQGGMDGMAARTADISKQVKVSDDLGKEFEQLKKALTDYSVKSTQPEKQSLDVRQLTVTDGTAKGRVVSKSDELMLLKNSAKPLADVEAAAQPTITEPPAEQPVIAFARADGTEVEVKPAEVVRQVAEDIIMQAPAAEDGSTEYSVTLNPEDLGSITVKLTKAVDGSLSVSIMAENAKTQRIIEQNGAAIQQELRSNGIELAEWQTVGESQHENRAEDYNGSSKNPYYRGEDNSDSGDDEDNSFAELISAM